MVDGTRSVLPIDQKGEIELIYGTSLTRARDAYYCEIDDELFMILLDICET